MLRGSSGIWSSRLLSRIRFSASSGTSDGDPAASFAMLDTASREITYCRVPYDVEAAADRIRGNGLPHWLADRLLMGK